MVVPFSLWGVSCLQNGPRIAEAVSPFVLLVAALKVMSSTSLQVCLIRFRFCLVHSVKYLRFQADDIAKQLSLISLVIAHLAALINHLHACHPLIRSELHLSRKIVNMLDESGHDLSEARVGISTHGVDDILGEFLAEASTALLIGAHVVVVLW